MASTKDRALDPNEYEFTKLERCLIRGMLNFNTVMSKDQKYPSIDEESWQFPKDIRRRGKFTSQSNNIPKCMSGLIIRGIVERRYNGYADKRNRTHNKYQYRLVPTLKIFEILLLLEETEKGLNLSDSTYFEQIKTKCSFSKRTKIINKAIKRWDNQIKKYNLLLNDNQLREFANNPIVMKQINAIRKENKVPNLDGVALSSPSAATGSNDKQYKVVKKPNK